MAKQIITRYVDDITGEPDAETVVFALGGDVYEIDLTEDNQQQLRAALAPYIEAGRRLKSISGRPVAVKPVESVKLSSSRDRKPVKSAKSARPAVKSASSYHGYKPARKPAKIDPETAKVIRAWWKEKGPELGLQKYNRVGRIWPEVLAAYQEHVGKVESNGNGNGHVGAVAPVTFSGVAVAAKVKPTRVTAKAG